MICSFDELAVDERVCSLRATKQRIDSARLTKSFDICVEKRQMFSRTELKSTTEAESARGRREVNRCGCEKSVEGRNCLMLLNRQELSA